MATNTRDAAGDLPDELLLDIFARLSADPVDLLLCAATCTRWLRLLAAADAAYLRRAGELPQNATIILGAFYQDDYLVHGPAAATPTVKKISDWPPMFRRLDDLSRPGLSIHPKLARLFKNAIPLASRHGLLLVRLMPVPLDHRKLHLAVCHPLIGGVHLVPPFHGRVDVTGYALLTGYGGEALQDHRQRRLAFRVLFTAVHLEEVVYAYSYSSATGSWGASITCPPQLRHLTMSGPRAGTVDGRGTTHWLYRDMAFFYTLDVSPDAAHVSLTRVSIPHLVLQPQPPFPCITHGGKLSLVITRPDLNLLQVWTERDEHDHEHNQDWILSALHISQRPAITPLKMIGFGEGRGAILVKCYSGLFRIDLDRMDTHRVRGSQDITYPREFCPSTLCRGHNSCMQCPYNSFVLYVIDWSSYLLHLSAWSPQEQQGHTNAGIVC